MLQQRQNLSVQFSALQADYDNLNARYEEESESASILRQSYSKLQADYAGMKTKLEKDLLAKNEELDELRYGLVLLTWFMIFLSWHIFV